MQVTIVDIQNNPDGSATVIVDLTPQFRQDFKAKQGLKRWSTPRFQKWFVSTIRNMLDQ